MIILTLVLLGQSWGGDYVIKKAPLVNITLHQAEIDILRSENEQLKAKIKQLEKQLKTNQSKKEFKYEEPFKYYLKDINGQVWEHTDGSTLFNFIKERNQQLEQQRNSYQNGYYQPRINYYQKPT